MLLFDPLAWLAVAAFLLLFFFLPVFGMALANRRDRVKAAARTAPLIPTVAPLTSLRCAVAIDGRHVPPSWHGDARDCIACQAPPVHRF